MGNDSGSSPQARGTRHLDLRAVPVRRFIPAGAGNTHQISSTAPCCAVHPRRRGEHATMPGGRDLAAGSSPQARGTPGDAAKPVKLCRFIPAGAGNTWRHFITGPYGTVHPRRRGEHNAHYRPCISVNGSSPQARGTLFKIPEPRSNVRFIPAGAGNTFSGHQRSRYTPVHPRRRGEHPLAALAMSP